MAIDAEETMQILERFTKLKQRDIPKELEDYLGYVAKTGDTVYTWANVKYLYREKLIHVIKDFHESTANIDDLPQYPNVDLFNYETMKSSLLERLDLFLSAPFTVQRLSELLTEPRKQYSRIDKFMRALEKNILVVSTVEPGRKQSDSENGDSLDSVVNGDLSLVVNVDLDMDNESIFAAENPQSIHVSVSTTTVTSSNNSSDDIELPNPKKLKLENDDEKAKSEETVKENKEEPDEKPNTTENQVEQPIDENINKDCSENLKSEEVSSFLNEDDSKELKCENKAIEPEKVLDKNEDFGDSEANEALISSQEDKLLNIDQLVSNEILTDIQEDNLLNVDDILNPEDEKPIDSIEIISKESDETQPDEEKNIEEEVFVEEQKEESIESNEPARAVCTEIVYDTKQDDMLAEKSDPIQIAQAEIYASAVGAEIKIPEQMSVEETPTVPIVESITVENIQSLDVNIREQFDKSPILDQPMDENIDEASAGDSAVKCDAKIESCMDVDDSTSQEAMDQ